MEHESVNCTNCDWCFWHSDWRIIKELGGFGSWLETIKTTALLKTTRISEKSPGDLRRLAVSQTPVKNHQLAVHNPAPVLEKDMHKLLWYFNIQTEHLIPARRSDLIIIKKKKNENLQNCRLCCPSGSKNKSDGMWKEG